MVNKATINKIKDKFVAFFSMIGTGEIKATMISPFGLYSKPSSSSYAITLDNNNLVIPLQNHKKVIINLEDDEVVLVDGESYIHLKTSSGDIDIKTNKLTINAKEFVVNANTSFNGSGVTHGGVNIGKTHTHLSTPVGSPTGLPQ